MKIKELKRTVNVSWSPCEQHPVLIAAGSSAQQVDVNFSSTSHLELYSLNLDDPGFDLELKSSLQTQHKFQKLVWSGAGILVGGCDGGLLQFYSADKLLKNTSDSLIGSNAKHNGNVSALDLNPYQKNLLASGASESEIFIWDLNNTSQPMAPGNHSQPYDHVQGLAWNQQVQHILGSTFATRCVVWDLRKNEPIMKLSDSQSRTRWRALSWHPSVATQLCIASEDDQVPVVQLWDLRLAASPLVTLEGHQKGVMALSWCKQDPDMLLSAGKDGKILCWNPNNTKPGGELLCEISQQQQWVFDIGWCPQIPGLFISASFDHHVDVHSLLGGSRPDTCAQNQNNIMDSFGGMESFNQLPVVQRAPAAHSVASVQPARAPVWLKRPVRSRFGFGGKLVTFEKCPQEAGHRKLVYISQVVSSPQLVEHATQLDAVLNTCQSNDPSATERLAEYCRQKGDAATDQNERYTWFFLRAHFLPTFRSEVMNLLGFKPDEIPSKFKDSNIATVDGITANLAALSRGESTETEAELSTDTSTDLSDAHTLIERKLSKVDGLEPTVNNVVIPNGEDNTGLICRALICGNLEEAVELCLEAKKIADALIIATLGSPELVYKVQKYYLQQTAREPVSLLCGSLLGSRWDTLVQSSAPSSWRETLGALVTHCDSDTLSHYCEMLGEKLRQEADTTYRSAALLCDLCAGAERAGRTCGPAERAERAERAVLFRRARPAQNGGNLETLLKDYAWSIADEGCLQTALNVLQELPDSELKERLQHALGRVQARTDRRTSHPTSQQFGSRSQTTSSHSQKRGHVVGHNDVSNTYSGVQAFDATNPWQQQSVVNNAFPPAAYNPSVAPPVAPVAPVLPPQPPLQPNRPSSVGPQSGGITTRSKYKVDPSVQSAPLYNQYSFNNAIVSQPQSFGYNSPLPDQYAAASVPTYAPVSTFNPPHSLNPAPLNTAAVNPVNSFNTAPLNGAPLNPANTLNAGVINGGYYQQQQAPDPQIPVSAAAPPKSAAPGWNDPPIMSSKPKPKQEVSAPAPITHPLFGVEPPQHVPLAPAAQYPGPQYPPQQCPVQQYPGQQYAEPQYPGMPNQGYLQQAPSPVPVEPAPPVEKPPLPQEHAVIQSVLDSLRAQCADRAVNPQMKRKLEDVQRRLESLYDVLREHRLSEGALGSLHRMVSHFGNGQYDRAGEEIQALATSGDFATAAAFLPGLKVLIQLSAQLQVYPH